MEVLFLTPWYPNVRFPLEGSFVEAQAMALAREGVEIEVACLHLSPFEILKPIYYWHRPIRTIEKGIPVIRIEGPFFPKRNALFTQLWATYTAKMLERRLRKKGAPKLLHAHTHLGALVAYQLHQKTNIPYIVTLHESLFLNSQMQEWRKKLLSPVFEEAAQITSVSTALEKSIRAHFAPSCPTSTIPNNIDCNLFFPSKKKPSFPPFHWAAVGDLKPIKQVDLLIKAFRLVSEKKKEDFHLHIIGYGPEQKSLEWLTRELGLENKVTFHGYLSPSAIPEALRKVHALVLSSRLETFGIVLAEALACGLPVVATDCQGPRDIVGTTEGVLVTEQSPEKLAEGMILLYDHYKEYQPAALFEYAKKHFSNTVVTKKIKTIYHKQGVSLKSGMLS